MRHLKYETWRAVVGAIGYEVSDQGRVRSLTRWVDCRSVIGLPYKSWRRGRILRSAPKPSGHHTVAIDGKSRDVHILVLHAFVGAPPPRHEARHRDGKPSNNRLNNLEWSKRRRNTQDRKYHSGASNHKLTPDIVLRLRRLAKNGRPHGFLSMQARRYGVSHTAIFNAITRRSHQDVA